MSPPPLPEYVRLPPAFVHLRVHTEFSIEDGITRIEELIKAASADGQVALGISDLSNLFGMVKHYKGCRVSGIKPISGIDMWVTNDQDRDKPGRILLLVQHREGYRQLCELISRAYLENKYHGRPELRREWLTPDTTNGLICLSGAQQGDIGMALAAGKLPVARELTLDWSRRFPDSFYVELQRGGHPGTEAYIQQAVYLAGELDLPVVATHPIQFLHREDFRAHEARVCIAQGYTLSDTRRPKHFSEEQYFKTQEEMLALFSDIPEALENSVEIAKRCSLSIVLGKHYLPQFPTPEGMSLDDFLIHEAYHGLDERLEKLYPDPEIREKEYPRYKERLEFELKTIVQMGFPGYFLIVADFIQWGKKNGVPIGPGRGSGQAQDSDGQDHHRDDHLDDGEAAAGGGTEPLLRTRHGLHHRPTSCPMGRITTEAESVFCQNSSRIGLLVVAEKATAGQSGSAYPRGVMQMRNRVGVERRSTLSSCRKWVTLLTAPPSIVNAESPSESTMRMTVWPSSMERARASWCSVS